MEIYGFFWKYMEIQLAKYQYQAITQISWSSEPEILQHEDGAHLFAVDVIFYKVPTCQDIKVDAVKGEGAKGEGVKQEGRFRNFLGCQNGVMIAKFFSMQDPEGISVPGQEMSSKKR